jgi:FkbM family methyltransferase
MYHGKFIIQIGSHVGNCINDPIFENIDENTKLILVEPVPYLFNQLIDNYKKKFNDLKNIIFLNKAVSDFVGKIEMTIPSEDNDFSKLPFWASQLSSIIPTHATDHIRCLKINKIIVETITLDNIIKEYNVKEIDLLNTDTEGHDYNILMNYSFIIKPKQILFEYKHIDGTFRIGEKCFELIKKLLLLGYNKKYQNNEDMMFEL